MIDEGKLRDEAVKAERAKRLLDDDLLNQAFDALETDYTRALFLTRVEDQNAREKLFLAVNVLRKVRDHLGTMVSNGALATHQLRELAELAERKKTWPEVG